MLQGRVVFLPSPGLAQKKSPRMAAFVKNAVTWLANGKTPNIATSSDEVLLDQIILSVTSRTVPIRNDHTGKFRRRRSF